MKRFNSKLILNHILSRAPHTKIYHLSHIFHGIPAHLHQNMESKDNTYLQIFQYDVFCQYMNHEQYRIIKQAPSFLMNNMHHLKQDGIAQKQQYKSITIQSRLIDVITKLMQNKDRFDIFQQVQQVIISMPSQQILKNNKQIIHLYRWLKTQKQWQNKQIKLLAQQLKITIINKIKQTNTKLQQILKKYKLSKGMKQDIKNQLQQQSEQLGLDIDMNMNMERNNCKKDQKIDEVVCMNKDKSQEMENVQIQRSR